MSNAGPSIPTIAVTLGDPAGIGPEVALRALADSETRAMARWILIGDKWLMDEVGPHVGYQPTDVVDSRAALAPALERSSVVVFDQRQLARSDWVIGRPHAASGRAGLAYVKVATELCLSGLAQAMVTAPLCKEAVALNGEPFTGHTEYIGQLCGVPEPRLMLYNRRLCVVHVSTHCSLLEATRLSTSRILSTIELGHAALMRLDWPQPRIAVCGLNPHAGEGGMFGREEAEFIAPAIAAARQRGIPCEGPFPADTLFMQAARGRYDLIVAMYHDQGHVPMKLMDFEHTVNVTLGLPIIRASVDHGTAFDIAGTYQASADDMKTTMTLAVRMTQDLRSEI